MPDLLDLGATRVQGGYFLRRHPWEPVPFDGGDGDSGPYRHCVTYRESPQTIRGELLTMLREARRKVFLTSFLVGDAELADELAVTAERLRGGVYIISALDAESLARGLAEREDEASVDPAERKRFETLARRGIYVRGHEHCHAKFAVVDDRVALVCSANFTSRGLRVTGESGVVVTDRAEVDRLARLFARLWHEGCAWEVAPVSEREAYTVEPRRPERWPGTVHPPNPDRPRVIWTDGDGERHILSAIRDLIGTARRELLLASFSLTGLRAAPDLLLDSLGRAVARGVPTRLLVRSRNNKAGHRADAAALAELGVEVLGDTLTHCKYVLADAERGALFSANFDAKHGLYDGVEVGCRLDGTSALATAVRFLEHAMAHADTQFVRHPLQQEMHDRLDTRWNSPWPLPRRLGVEADDAAWGRLAAASRTGPILFTRAGGVVRLIAGRERWLLPQGSSSAVVRLDPDRTAERKPSSNLLRKWLNAGADQDDTERGFCPAVLERIPSERRLPSS
jgi:cardiolipin synthase A/B